VTSRDDTIGIVGAGAFGLALANVVARAGRDVILWSTSVEVVESVRRGHSGGERLPDVALDPRVVATRDAGELAAAARLVVVAVSSTEVVERARALSGALDGSHLVVHAIGALVGPGERRVSQVLEAELPTARIGALAGPALPGDLVRGSFASMVCASAFDEVTAEARRLLGAPPALRLYRSRDLVGVELAAALSGAYSVVLGVVDALELGPGTRAVVITRALAEATRLGEAAGAESRTFAGLAGLGNLLVRTSPVSGDHAPGYQFGRSMARGVTPVRTPESVRAAPAAVALARRLGQRTPVLEALARVLDRSATIKEAAGALAETVALEE
jgi:glycerol-3-phosphate dehydrogenase (NAD(P)+)